MSWSNIRWTLAREIRDQLRDRRTMFMIVVLPILLYPLLGMAILQVSQLAEEAPVRVLLVGREHVPEEPPLVEGHRFVAGLFNPPEQARLVELEFAPEHASAAVPPADPLSQAGLAVQYGQYDAALCFPSDFRQRLDQFRQALCQGASGPEVPRPVFIYTTATEKSQRAFARLLDVWQRWNDRFRRANLAAMRLPESMFAPIEPETIDVAEATGHSGAAIWSKVLPVLLLMWALTGAFYPAVDLCAGEKERGTLETLLSSPAERSEIVLGKLLTIMLFSSLTAVLNVLSMGTLGWVVLSRLPGFGPVPLAGAVWMAIALVPASALFSALCLGIAAFARSTKEGQYYLMPLLLGTIPLAVLPTVSGMELNLGNSLVPVMGMVLVLRAALEGNYAEALQFLPPVAAVTLAGCLLAVRWAVAQFNCESVLFREGERLDVRLWLRHLVRDRRATPTAAAAASCGIVILLARFVAGVAMPSPGDFPAFAVTVLATQLAVIAGPAVLMAFLLTRSPRQTLLLRWPPWLAPIAAAVLAVALHPAVKVLQAGVFRLYPLNEVIEKQMRDLDALFSPAPFWAVAAILALTPAICEELAFRGFILSGFRQGGATWRAIVISAAFFGLTHSILQQSLVAAVVGVVIGYLAVRTESIVPAMVFHFVHNALAATAVPVSRYVTDRWPALEWLLQPGAEDGQVFRWPAVLAGGLAAVAILAWFHRLPRGGEKSAPVNAPAASETAR